MSQQQGRPTFFEVMRQRDSIGIIALAGIAGVSEGTVKRMLMDSGVAPESAAKVLSALSTMTGAQYSLENVAVVLAK